jgi:hypothetical protein
MTYWRKFKGTLRCPPAGGDKPKLERNGDAWRPSRTTNWPGRGPTRLRPSLCAYPHGPIVMALATLSRGAALQATAIDLALANCAGQGSTFRGLRDRLR